MTDYLYNVTDPRNLESYVDKVAETSVQEYDEMVNEYFKENKDKYRDLRSEEALATLEGDWSRVDMETIGRLYKYITTDTEEEFIEQARGYLGQGMNEHPVEEQFKSLVFHAILLKIEYRIDEKLEDMTVEEKTARSL